MRIQHNIAALNSYRNLTNNNSAVSKNLEKLSSGYRINRAGDDAAGLAISEKMRAQITGLETAQKNASDGVSLVQTAEGALTEVHSMLNRMVELATQSANGTYDNEVDRVQLQKELDQLRTEINRIADSSNFNGIKLFDGSLSGADITTSGITTSQVDMAKGVEVVQGTNGGGTKGTFTINVSAAFGTGDMLQLNFGGNIANATANGGLNTANKQLTFGTDFKGNTLEEQAKSIANALSKDGNIAKSFDVTVNGTAVTLTAKVEGNKITGSSTDKDITSTVTSVEITDKQNLDRAWKQEAADVATDGTLTAAKVKIEGLFDNAAGKGMDIKDGDVLQLAFKLSDGTELTTSLTYGTDFLRGDTPEDTLDNIITALGNASLDDNEDTILDESKLKLSDIMTVAKESNKNLEFTAVDGSVDWDAVGDIKITNINTGVEIASAAKGANATTPAAAKVVVGLSAGTTTGALPTTTPATTAATNLTTGDKITLAGKLADGRTFEFTVEAGKDFKVDDATFAHSSNASTMTNMKALLESDDFKITLSDGSTVKGSEIFGDDAEVKITLADAGTATFESVRAGTHTGTEITSAKLTAGAKTAVDPSLKNGDQQTSADSVITFSEGLAYGATIEVDGKKYELVKSAGDVSNGQNKAVIVDDITDANAAARALKGALDADLDSANYKVSVNNGTVTIGTTKVGSTTQAISASASGDKTTQVEFTLDPTKMKAGSTVTINGQTYEFINKGGKASDKTYETIEVVDFDKETSASLGGRLANLANAKNDASVTMDENGKITVRGLVNSDNKIVTPMVKFDGGTSGLTLQIGDTAEDFNKMTVSIYNMHTADMGIGDIRIDTQDAAADAVDKIKSAINYVSDVRGTLGATQNRLDHTINNLSVQTENITAAESRIRDVDMAQEMMAYTKNNILVQAAQAMLAQANQVPQGVLQLLQ